MYLLQLVQALRFEKVTTDTRSGREDDLPKEESALAEFLIERGVRNAVLGNRLHWYLMVEVEDKENGKMYGRVAFKFQERLSGVSLFSALRLGF